MGSGCLPLRAGGAAVLASRPATGVGRRAVHARHQRASAGGDRRDRSGRYSSSALLLSCSLLDDSAIPRGSDRKGAGAFGSVGAGDDRRVLSAVAECGRGVEVSAGLGAIAVPDSLWPHGALLHDAALAGNAGAVLWNAAAAGAAAARRDGVVCDLRSAVALHALSAG